MAKMKAVQIPKAGAAFEIVERDIPQPDAGQVRIRVQACGICHSDVISKEGLFGPIRSLPPTLKYEPRLILAEEDFVIVHGRFSGLAHL